MTSVLQVFTTTETEADARKIAEVLVNEQLAACVQIVGPIMSTYRWQGKIETAGEWLCIIKTTQEAYDDLESAIRGMHSYEVPEILAVPVVAGSRDYIDWLRGSVKK